MRITTKGSKEEITRIKKEFKLAVEARTARQAERMKDAIADNTPVDTGMAQAGWALQGSKYKYVLVNPVPYIKYLNRGTSKQAPAHFIELTAIKFGRPVGTIVEER